MSMKKEYDFSKGERGKFYRPGMKLNIPIYLEEEVAAFVEKIASKKGIDRSSVVNGLLRGDIMLAEAMEVKLDWRNWIDNTPQRKYNTF
jgi:hypothetical protein